MLTIPLGKSTAGKPFITDLKRMPHLLIAGSTGSGKSVCINSILVGLLCVVNMAICAIVAAKFLYLLVLRKYNNYGATERAAEAIEAAPV